MVSFPKREQTTGSVIAFPKPRHVRETPKAAAAYREYELLGPERSLRKLANSGQSGGKPWARLHTLEQWSSQHHWQERVAQYDEQQAEIKRKKRQDEIEKMDERHATYGRSSLYSVVEYLQKHFADEATLPDAIRLMKVAYELERLARGAATSKVDADVKVGVLAKEYINIDPDECFSEP